MQCCWLLLLLGVFAVASVTNRESPFESSPDRVVEALMVAGDVGPSSVVLDLGSGDGRVVFAAARLGASATGVEIDLELVRKARRAAKKEGLSNLATFKHGDIFLLPPELLQKATVVVVYLIPSAVADVESLLIRHLTPGTVVLAHDYPLLNMQHEELWSADDVADKMPINGETSAYIYRYVVPSSGATGDKTATGTAVLNFTRRFSGKHSLSLSTQLKTRDGRFQGVLHGVAEDGRLRRVVLQGAADARAPVLSFLIKNAETGAVIRRGSTEPVIAGGEKRDAIPLPSLPLPIAISVTFSAVDEEL